MLARSHLQNKTIRWSHHKRILKRFHANSSKSVDSKKEPVEFAAVRGLAVGSLAGLCGSLVGMGGGFIMIPIMTSRFLRLSQHQAHGTSLFAVTTTGIAGALGYSGHVDYEAAASIACTGIVAARFGAMAMSRLPEAVLRKALGVLMLSVAPLVPAKTYFMELSKDKEEKLVPGSTEVRNPQRLLVPALIGSFSGFAAGLFGVGGGAIVVPALAVFTDMNHYQALGTSLCAMALPAISGTITHYGKGNVAMRVAPGLAAGAFLGAYLGGKLGLTIEETKLRWGFSGLMVVLGVRTFLK
eukprot:scaffold1278_cov191-Cylindrotheca_fusiformis.AAC.6